MTLMCLTQNSRPVCFPISEIYHCCEPPPFSLSLSVSRLRLFAGLVGRLSLCALHKPNAFAEREREASKQLPGHGAGITEFASLDTFSIRHQSSKLDFYQIKIEFPALPTI